MGVPVAVDSIKGNIRFPNTKVESWNSIIAERGILVYRKNCV